MKETMMSKDKGRRGNKEMKKAKKKPAPVLPVGVPAPAA
jgi:hypothetical protein